MTARFISDEIDINIFPLKMNVSFLKKLSFGTVKYP